MTRLAEIQAYCDDRLDLSNVPDFPGAQNGLQLENDGTVTRLGAAVDANLDTIQQAITQGVDLLFVHHGLFWVPLQPLTGPRFAKVARAASSNLAIYSAHLPLDRHPTLGNNAGLARAAGLTVTGTFLPHEGVDMGLVTAGGLHRDHLRTTLEGLFPQVVALEFGAETPEKIGIVTGSGASVVPELRKHGLDTLITGELRQHLFTVAQEEKLTVYSCGHYATETFGVKALATEVAEKFRLPWVFLETDCPL